MFTSPAGGGHIKVNLLPKQHYYYATYQEDLGPVPGFRIEQHSCQQAQQENRTAKPLEQKHIKDYGLARAVADAAFPACP
jgi:hypothetical protein